MSDVERRSPTPETTGWNPPGVDLEGEAAQSVILCKACGATVPWNAAFCPGCAAPQRDQQLDDTTPIAEQHVPPQPHTTPLVTEAPPVEAEATAPPRSSAWRSRALIAVACVLAVLLGVAAAWWLIVIRPANAALAAAEPAIAAVEGVFADATGVEGLDAAALQVAVRDLEAAFAATEGRVATGVWDRAVDVIGAERAVAVALVELAPEGELDLRSWSGAIGDAAGAVGTLTDAYGEHEVSGRASTDVLGAGVAAVAADVAISGTADGLAELLADLSAAEKVTDVADVGATAGERVVEVAVIREVIEDELVLGDLRTITGVMAALEGLDGLDPERLDRWEAVHADIRAEVRQLGEIDGSRAEQIAATATTAVRSTDQLIDAAATAIGAWEEEVAAVQESIRDDLSALDSYSTTVESQLSRYSDLRSSTQDFSDKIKSGAFVTYDEGYAFFYEASEQRGAVREAINGATPPSDVGSAHNGLLGVIDRAILAIDAAVEGTWQDQTCWYDCYYADTPGWQRFVSESQDITREFGSAESTWRSALGSARTAIEGREFPTMPDV
jgi:hypothetical protein